MLSVSSTMTASGTLIKYTRDLHDTAAGWDLRTWLVIRSFFNGKRIKICQMPREDWQFDNLHHNLNDFLVQICASTCPLTRKQEVASMASLLIACVIVSGSQAAALGVFQQPCRLCLGKDEHVLTSKGHRKHRTRLTHLKNLTHETIQMLKHVH